MNSPILPPGTILQNIYFKENELTLYPLHLLQKYYCQQDKALVIYAEATLTS